MVYVHRLLVKAVILIYVLHLLITTIEWCKHVAAPVHLVSTIIGLGFSVTDVHLRIDIIKLLMK